MIIKCKGCQTKYNIDEKKIPAGLKQAKCKTCGETIFRLKSSVSPKPIKKSQLCPKCGYQLSEEKQNECQYCGIIIDKYIQIINRQKEEEKRRKIEEEERRIAEEEEEREREEEERKQNLIHCSICTKEISKNAEICPFCGEPLKKIVPIKEHKKSKINRFGCIILVGLFIFISIYNEGSNTGSSNHSNYKSSNTSSNVPIVSNSPWDGSVYQVKHYLKTILKDPDSFQAIEWSPVQKIDTGYVVRCKYRAKNSFGGYIIENRRFYLDKNGNVFHSELM